MNPTTEWSSAAAAAATSGSPHTNSSEVLVRLLQAARRHLGLDVSFISEFAEGDRVIRHVDAAVPGAVAPGDSSPLEESYCQRVVDGRLPQLIVDVRELADSELLPTVEGLAPRAHVSVPLTLADGRVYGTFCCYGGSADTSLNQRDLGVVRMFADVAMQYIEADLEAADRHAAARARITSALGEDGCLTTVFQPITSLEDGRVMGFEALSRFSAEPSRTPDVWFAEASAIGLGPELEAAAVRSAVAALPSLAGDVFLSVNVSPEVVVSGALDGVLHDVDLTRIVLEMTEHTAVRDYGRLADALRPFKDRGARVAVDDAGAGYASLRHILRLAPDWIKLDISITRGLDADPARTALARAVIDFAADTGSEVIAEGVETQGELRALQALGGTGAQGYFLGRPGDLAAAVGPSPTPPARRAGRRRRSTDERATWPGAGEDRDGGRGGVSRRRLERR
jgi:EAL domain-containing protein (putative c-di-GMP-specific phosphodiesterase class I)